MDYDYAIIPCGCVRWAGILAPEKELRGEYPALTEDDIDTDAAPPDALEEHLIEAHGWKEIAVEVYLGIPGKVF